MDRRPQQLSLNLLWGAGIPPGQPPVGSRALVIGAWASSTAISPAAPPFPTPSRSHAERGFVFQAAMPKSTVRLCYAGRGAHLFKGNFKSTLFAEP